jgi:uncharacterized damage-inducible protein DinB
METEAWLSGKLDGFSPVVMPAAHALAQAIVDLQRVGVLGLTENELFERVGGASSVAFHLRHIAGSIDRLLAYSRGEELNEQQFAALRAENSDERETAAELTQKAVDGINNALEALKTVAPETLFEDRFVGRKRLPTTVFGLLFHIAEHTARHVGQVVTTAKIVQNRKNG